MDLLKSNDRCNTILDNGVVVKKYADKDSFITEKRVYELLKEKPYIPKLISADDNLMEIRLEYLGDNSLEVYTRKNPIPKDLFKKLYDILLDMLDVGIFDVCEHRICEKLLEHVFICDNGDIKLIDFDVEDIYERND